MRGEKIIFIKNKNIVARKIDNELFLIPLIKSADGINAIYSLNNMAIKIWDLIDGKKSIEKIRDNILERYDVKPERLREDLETFIKDALKIKAIKKVSRK